MLNGVVLGIETNKRGVMITVRIIYKDGTEDIKACNNVDEICLDGVESIKIIRNERAA